jgi:hypothetical protein
MGLRIPDKNRAAVEERDGHACVRCRIPTIMGQWHHRRSRSVRDDHTHCTCNGIYLCATCHRWVHANPFDARANGWIVSRYKNPFEEPAFILGRGWQMLTCDGVSLNVPT